MALLNLANGNSIRTFRGHKTYVEAAAFSPDGKYIVSSAGNDDAGGEIKIRDAATGGLIRTFDVDE